LLQILDLENFATAYRLSKYVIKLAEKGGCSERDKLGRRWSADNTSGLRCSVTIVYRTDHQALSTARFCHAGQSATADTYLFIHYTVSQKVSPLNILHQPPQTCTHKTTSIFVIDVKFHKNPLFRLRDVRFFQTAITNLSYRYYFFTMTAARSVTSTI